MFASTFKRTHWLVPGYLLGQTWRRTSSWKEIALANPASRGVPVSQPVSLESTTCVIRCNFTTLNKLAKPHSDA